MVLLQAAIGGRGILAEAVLLGQLGRVAVSHLVPTPPPATPTEPNNLPR